MFVSATKTRCFRNLDSEIHFWSQGLNLLTGLNGSGKTNVLESINLMTGWGPFKSEKMSDLKTWNAREEALITGKLSGEESSVVDIRIVERASLRIDGKKCTWGDLRLKAPSLSFLPSDMALIEGSPSVRRHFMDVLCCVLFPLYALRLSEYRKIISHRKALLVRSQSPSVTDEVLLSLGSWIWGCRDRVVRSILSDVYRWDNLVPFAPVISLRRGGSQTNLDLSEDFARSLLASRDKERIVKTTFVGPHRDDLVLTTPEGRNVSSVLSRGQRRKMAICLILAAGSLIERALKKSPILILDEVFAELDVMGKRDVVAALESSGWQVFAASTDDENIPWPGSVWRVRDGVVS